MEIKPILFNTDMVKAILEGRKTQTRRIIKPQPTNPRWSNIGWLGWDDGHGRKMRKPYYEIGDVLWVRETWSFIPCIDCNADISGACNMKPVTHESKDTVTEGCFVYCADYPEPEHMVWHPSIHMPKEAARIFLKVTDARIARLQDMTGDDALCEGAPGCLFVGEEADPAFALCRFTEIWNNTIDKKDMTEYGWDTNPWVWAITFERCEKPEGWCDNG